MPLFIRNYTYIVASSEYGQNNQAVYLKLYLEHPPVTDFN